MPYKNSSRRRSKTKAPGKFEIGAFGLVIGFAIGLTCGILMGGFTWSSSEKAMLDELERERRDVAASDYREQRLQASMQRLKQAGKDVEILHDRYAPELSGKVEKLNVLLSNDAGPITIEDL